MKTLGALAAQFGQLAAGGYRANLTPILLMIGGEVQIECQKEIGEYQGAVSPYPATAPLADSTIFRKTLDGLGKGGNPDTPLWATGDYHDSIQFKIDVERLCVYVGSNVEYVKYLELGTSRMPPRPLFGPATLRMLPKMLPRISVAAGVGMAGGVWSGLSAEAITHTPLGANANLEHI